MPVKKLRNKPIQVGKTKYQRYPIQTKLIGIKEDVDPILKEVKKLTKKDDIVSISEKFLAISEGRVLHKSLVKPGWLAKTITQGVRKQKVGIGYKDPHKIQVAIMQAGWVRVFAASIIGGITRIFGRQGDFYRIAGNRVSEIDAFSPLAMKPFDEFAILGPSDPQKIAQELEKKLGVGVLIMDANYQGVETLGKSKKVKLKEETINKIFSDNPAGQDDELTPIIIIRKN